MSPTQVPPAEPNIWLLLVLIVLVSIALWALVMWAHAEHVFRYNPDNPYRRFCKRCGQCQTACSRTWASADQWWETVCPVPDPTCHCHKHSEYRR